MYNNSRFLNMVISHMPVPFQLTLYKLSCLPFIFQRPINLQLKPDYGPIAGGTAISITGELLGDQSVDVFVFLVDNLELEKYAVIIYFSS